MSTVRNAAPEWRMIPLSGWGETAGSLIGNTYRIRLMTGRSGNTVKNRRSSRIAGIRPSVRAGSSITASQAGITSRHPGSISSRAASRNEDTILTSGSRGSYQSNEQGSKDKLLYAFLGIITVILVIGIIWGVATLMDLNDEEDTTVETQEASAEEINPDLESETEEAVTVTPTPTAAPTSTPIPTPAVTAAPAATAVPTQAPAASSGDYVIPDSSVRN